MTKFSLTQTVIDIHTAIDTSAANDPAVQFITRIAMVILIIAMVIKGAQIYADKSKRGELITEVVVGVIAVGLVLFPQIAITILATLWGFLAGWLTQSA